MKIRKMVVSMALLMLVAATANAGTTWFGVTGGVGMPTGDYGDAASNGWNIGANVTQSINDMWGVGADLGFHSWGGNSDAEAALTQLSGANTDITYGPVQGTAHAIVNFPTQSPMKPYMKAGVGLYNVSYKVDSPGNNSDDSKSEFGYNLGAGMTFATHGNMQWGLGAAYHIIPMKDDFGTGSPDANFATVGLNLRWGVSH